MASIDITTQSGAVGNGDLQLQNGAPMDGTLRFVTDALNTASPLKLSTSLVQTTSTLKITTNDNPYIDAEDGAGNNRFTVGRDTGSQQVNVDFASNPGGSTTIVGAIRTYVDGVNLSEVMAFREDGNIGINTLTPGAKLDIHSASNVIMQLNRTGAGKSWLQYLQAGTARWNTGYDNTNGNFTIYDAVNAADRMVVTNAGNVGIGTSTPSAPLEVRGSLGIRVDEDGTSSNVLTLRSDFAGAGPAVNVTTNSPLLFLTNNTERMRITAAGNVGIGTTTPSEKLVVTDGSILTQGIGGGGAFNILQPITPNPDARTWAMGASVAAFGDFGIKQSNAKDGDPITAGDTKFYISRFGNVGIGTTTPFAKLEVAGTSANTDFRISRTVDPTANLYITAPGGATLTSIFGISGTDIFSIDTNKYIRLASASGGIQFNGDTAAANALDDYEEGTFTPTIGGTWITNPTSLSGRYTKIGRMVYVSIEFTGGVKSTSTSGYLDGLPFAGAIGGGGTVTNVNVDNKGIMLLDNSTIIWFTEINFGGLATKAMGSYML